MAVFAAETNLCISSPDIALLRKALAISARGVVPQNRVGAQALSKAAAASGEGRPFRVSRNDVIGLIALAGSAAYLCDAGVIDGIEDEETDFPSLMYDLRHAYDFLSASDQETADCEYENNYVPASSDMI
ncbi:hypothetical protein [uncultured Methylobacterium sp.]|jgi:hypothetical protein|uniref:hypothetical protein n=1 Tax=uncultured Methylobacterium sp. TaxID=157278 RepID=UPI002624E296|nr:hypothetical protein [uncultured Methylobacterium sp.]